jgi:hypothetical protein
LNCTEEVQAPVQLHDRAMENLSFIRDAMDRSAPVTAVSGFGMILMGCIALMGGCVSALRRSPDWWIYSWLVVAALGCSTGFIASQWKGSRQNRSLLSGVGRRFTFSFAAPVIAGIVLTEVFYELQFSALMPGTWLLLYGVGVYTGGAFSVPIVPRMGLCFMVLGALTLFPVGGKVTEVIGPFNEGDLLLLIGFGGLHILFGGIIAKKYGG